MKYPTLDTNEREILEQKRQAASDAVYLAQKALRHIECSLNYCTQYSVSDLIELYKKVNGGHFFDKDTLKYFGSRIHSTIWYGNVFITSEFTGFDRSNRAYTVRRLTPEGDIEGVSSFCEFKTLAQAKKLARAHSDKLAREEHK